MKAMKRAIVACTAALLATMSFASQPELASVRKVYVLPMATGLDQYVAQQLVAQGVLEVVTDLAQADAILSDQVGPRLERQVLVLEHLAGRRRRPEGTSEAPATVESGSAGPGLLSRFEDDLGPLTTGFGRTRGNVFLVSRTTGTVLWSTYRRLHRTTPDALHSTAREIVGQLKKAVRSTKR